MIPQSFEYVVAASLSEAVGLLAKHGDDARVLAGGHSLIPMMKLRIAMPAMLIDIGRLSELAYIRTDGGALRIGALATHNEIATSAEVRARCAALADAAASIGDIQVRNKGTIGGSLAHADPGADYPAAVLAADATIVAAGAGGERDIPASEFFVDMLTSALEPGEIVREIRIPGGDAKTRSAYVKMAQKASGFAICGAAAVVGLDSAGALARIGVGITGVGARAFRAAGTEAALVGKKPDPETVKAAAALAPDGVTALADIHASADYRLDLARIFTARAILQALERE